MGFGFVAQVDGEIAGVAAATESTAALFRYLLGRRPFGLAWAVLRRLVQSPSLLAKALQTLTYPSHDDGLVEAELLFIGLRRSRRGQGLGRALLLSLCREGEQRALPGLKVMVDATNQPANDFYRRYGFVHNGDFTLYGRQMNWSELALPLPPGAYEGIEA